MRWKSYLVIVALFLEDRVEWGQVSVTQAGSAVARSQLTVALNS